MVHSFEDKTLDSENMAQVTLIVSYHNLYFGCTKTLLLTQISKYTSVLIGDTFLGWKSACVCVWGGGVGWKGGL